MSSCIWRQGIWQLCLLGAVLGAPVLAGEGSAAKDSVAVAERQQAVALLRAALLSQPEWIKVHAAECLLALDYRQDVGAVFQRELAEHGDQPQYRIGIWRVLAIDALDAQRRQHFIGKIRAAFLDPVGIDRARAAESLALLGYRIGSISHDDVDATPAPDDLKQPKLLRDEERQIFAAAATATALRDRGVHSVSSDDVNNNARLQVSAQQVLLQSALDPESRRRAVDRLLQLLKAGTAETRSAAAEALARHSQMDPQAWQAIQRAARDEPTDSPARISLTAAQFLHAQAMGADPTTLQESLLSYATDGSAREQSQACGALAAQGTAEIAPLLMALMSDDDTAGDVKVAAANAICRIGRRQPKSLAALDWVIIGAYGIGMVLVGWYYSRRTQSTEDFLLGGRNMRPWAVGLSLFATLLSTISYLARPGEMIEHGPMILCQVLSYPLIVLTVCYLTIPFIMGLKVTSAYELLEKRFDVSVRLLGAIIFLVLRLLWMSVIVFATSDKVLIPLLGLEPTIWTPILCAILGVITLIYTSLGGLRAVVVTDVVQTAILIGGAMLALVTITIDMGGVAAWWPHEWSPRWAPPAYGFQTDARVTLGWAVVATYLWYVCTATSDQMAIQRYLATRDVKAAQRSFWVTMLCDAVVTSLLALLGLALFAYFQANPNHLPDGQSLQENADQLFTQFIVFGLPSGVTGLVVAGLLAAAMSSLSSGMNSSCAVVTTDFFDRFQRDPARSTNHVLLTRYVSLAVGVAVVALSLFVNMTPGNLLEVAFKVVNLFVVPLFMLFFMAMYVPWSTTFGVWSSATASALTAIGIAYGAQLAHIEPVAALLEACGFSVTTDGPSFLFILPGALLVGVATGTLMSLLPIGPPAKHNLSELKTGNRG